MPAWLFSWPTKILAAIGLAAAIFGAGYVKGVEAGRVDQLEETIDAYKDREEIDNEISGLGDYALCLELGGLPADCEQLRGVEEGQP